MDFGTLLQTAKQNEAQKKEVRTYNTKFAPPKKADKKDKVLSANIQKFLARKENEEKKRAMEANRKRDELLFLRSKDKKATRRVNVMLKRTKSANQSVIDDAVDNENTAVTLAGPAQPDEDDYGYVSQEASAFYTKMMEKYNKLPEEQKFPNAKKRASSNLSSTKDRVRAALEKEKLDATLPHKRKRKHKEGEEHDKHDNEDGGNESDGSSMPPPKAKPKLKAPPPMNFTELLQLASQKQHEPIVIEVKPKDEGPLFTKKQKQELEKEQQRRVGDVKGKLTAEQINEIRKLPPSYLYKTKRREVSRAEVRSGSDDSDDYEKNQIAKAHSDQNIRKQVPNNRMSNSQVPKTKENESKTYAEEMRNGAQSSKSNPEKPPSSKTYFEKTPKDLHLPKTSNDARLSKDVRERLSGDCRRTETASNSKKMSKTQDETRHSKPLSNKQINDNRSMSKASSDNRIAGAQSDNRLKPSSATPRKQETGSYKEPGTSKLHSYNGVQRPRIQDNAEVKRKPFPSNNQQAKQLPSKDLKPKQFPPPDVVRRKESLPNNARSKSQIGNKRPIIDDADEEYDSEMDDFIDDGPEESNDYSTYIREIFGYDKRKYKIMDDDEDDDNMESSFAQQMREDVRSTKLGIMEDLEDIKKEKEEKRRKVLKKKGRV